MIFLDSYGVLKFEFYENSRRRKWEVDFEVLGCIGKILIETDISNEPKLYLYIQWKKSYFLSLNCRIWTLLFFFLFRTWMLDYQTQKLMMKLELKLFLNYTYNHNSILLVKSNTKLLLNYIWNLLMKTLETTLEYAKHGNKWKEKCLWRNFQIQNIEAFFISF